MFNGLTKYFLHCLHCILFFSFICIIEFISGALWRDDRFDFDPWERYGTVGTITLYLLRAITLLNLPQVLLHFIGLVFYNAFPDQVQLKGSLKLAPFICFRVVTRGNFPDLVKRNVTRNMNICTDAGLENFLIEVVTDKALGLSKNDRVREVVVPTTYVTKSGAIFKARALQYCLEDSVNKNLGDADWIVHLDEETLLTENSVRGILNFVMDGKYQFGQGLITYANEDVVNWLTTLADSYRVADDMGKLRSQFNLFHKPLFGWKGSFLVSQASAEKKVSFDNGLDGSITEDCYFAMNAFQQGYTFGFIEGEMWEKSPFTLCDFLQQRKRWLQGLILVVHSKCISFKYKMLLAMWCYFWITLPFSSSNFVLALACPIPCPQIYDLLCGFMGAFNIYMYIFGLIKSFSVYRFGYLKLILCICSVWFTIPFYIIIENVAAIWAVIGKKHKFYIVNKDTRPPITV